MKCKSCNADLKENARFCEFCGKPVELPSVEQQPVQQPIIQQQPIQQTPVTPAKKKNTSAIIIAILLAILIALGVGFFVLLNNKNDNDDKEKSTEKESQTEMTSNTSEQNTEAPPKTPSNLVADESDKEKFEDFMGCFVDGCMGNYDSSKETTLSAITKLVFDGVTLPAYWTYIEEPYMGEYGYVFSGYANGEETPDPLNRFGNESIDGYYKLKESDVKWIVENCGGVIYSVVTDFGDPTGNEEGFEVNNENAYYYDGYYYFRQPGGVGCETSLKNFNYSMDSNGIYTITAELYNTMVEDEEYYELSCTYKAELIEADGRRVWRMINSEFHEN